MPSHPSTDASYVAGSSGATASNLNGPISSEGRYFTDPFNRRLLLHGASISGLNKLPTRPNGFTHLAEGFFEHKTVSFVGRPFPLDEADEHLARLQFWGLTFVRLVIPWESLEHEGPGLYDEEYIEYLYEIVKRMSAYGIKCFVDAHQDVWSRHTGGSGAPHWTLELVGFDLRGFKPTAAAHAHNLNLGPLDPPANVWPSGTVKLAAATMSTIFWAGNIFAPKRKVPAAFHRNLSSHKTDMTLQDFLQYSMIEAFAYLGERLKGLDAMMGLDAFNEPHKGYVGMASPFVWDHTVDLAIGYFPSAAESWALGEGYPVIIGHYAPKFPVTAKTHDLIIKPKRKAWSEAGCVWKEHGVWAWDPTKGEFGEAVVLRMDYFLKHPETREDVDWYEDCYWPFCQKLGARMNSINPSWFNFVEPLPNEFSPPWDVSLRPQNLVFAPHWYDLQALFSKRLTFWCANVQGLAKGMFILKALYIFDKGRKKNYSTQIGNIAHHAYERVGEVPVVIGETGIPFDINDKISFRTGDYSRQEAQLDAILSAMEDHLLNFNLWNYNPLNTHEWGDSWNAEDFSIYSLSDRKTENLDKEDDLAKFDNGGRCLDAVVRPYASKIAGDPISTTYDKKTLTFQLSFKNNPSVLARETEIYLPSRTYKGKELRVTTSDKNDTWSYNEHKQTLYWLHANSAEDCVHRIKVGVTGVSSTFPWYLVVSYLFALLAILIYHKYMRV